MEKNDLPEVELPDLKKEIQFKILSSLKKNYLDERNFYMTDLINSKFKELFPDSETERLIGRKATPSIGIVPKNFDLNGLYITEAMKIAGSLKLMVLINPSKTYVPNDNDMIIITQSLLDSQSFSMENLKLANASMLLLDCNTPKEEKLTLEELSFPVNKYILPAITSTNAIVNISVNHLGKEFPSSLVGKCVIKKISEKPTEYIPETNKKMKYN